MLKGVAPKAVTVCCIGKTGTGKSTLNNALLVGNPFEDDESINSDDSNISEKIPFPDSGGIDACTTETRHKDG